MGDFELHLGDLDGPSPDEYADYLADMNMECRCPPMTDSEIDAMAALFGQ